MNFLRITRHSKNQLITSKQFTSINNLQSTRPLTSLFNPQPVENFVGQCPIYGHKYYETPIQKYGAFNKWEITVEKRRVDWNADYGTFGKMDPSQQHLLIQEIMRKRLFTVEWERWLRSKRLNAPSDKEIAVNTIKKNTTAAKGKALENMYRENPGVAATGEGERVYTPGGRDDDGKYQYEGQTTSQKKEQYVEYKDVHEEASEQYEIYRDASDIGKNFGDQGHTSYKKSYVGAQSKDGIEEADVQAWDPNK